MDLEGVAADLYALPLKEFTKTRNALAKEVREAGERELAKQIKGLKKPTRAAWLLNGFVRRQRDEIDEVLALGAQFRGAQDNLQGELLRELDRWRRQLTAAITRQAKGLGRDLGQRVSDQIAAEVEETLRAAMVQRSAGARWAAGSWSTPSTRQAMGGSMSAASWPCLRPAPTMARRNQQRRPGRLGTVGRSRRRIIGWRSSLTRSAGWHRRSAAG